MPGDYLCAPIPGLLDTAFGLARVRDSRGETPLHVVARAMNLAATQYLLLASGSRAPWRDGSPPPLWLV